MVNAISGINSYYSIYRPSRAAGLTAEQTGRAQQIKNSVKDLEFGEKTENRGK